MYEYMVVQLGASDLRPVERASQLNDLARGGWQVISTVYVPKGQGWIEHTLERKVKA